MALSKDSTGYYLEPSTGQYYSVYNRPTYNYSPFGYMGMGGWQSQEPTGMGAMGYSRPADPEGMISEGGKYYIPFTGSATGISNGKRSVIDALIANKQPYQYNVPSIAQMFPSLIMPTVNTQAPSQYTGGAGQFLGGLLGTGGAGQYTSSTGSSGAGRFA